MSEIEKLYENAEIEKDCKLYGNYSMCPYKTRECTDCKYFIYPSFTAFKQLKIEEVILENAESYDRYLEYHKTSNGEWLVTFTQTNKLIPHFITLQSTREEAFAQLINNKLWQDLTEQEKEQIKEILNG